MDNNTQNQTPVTPIGDAGVTAPTDQPVAQPAPMPVDPMDAASQMSSLPTVPVGTGDTTAPAAPQPIAMLDPMVVSAPVDQAVQPVMPTMPMDTTVPAATPTMDVNAPVLPAAPVIDATAAVVPTAASMPAPMQMGPVTNEELMEELQRIEDRLDEIDEKL